MRPIETITHNDRTIEIFQDEDAANPRENYDHLGLLAVAGSSKHLSDEGEAIEDKEGWLIAMVDAVDSAQARRIEHIDELIDRVQGQRSFAWNLCKLPLDRRPGGTFTPEEGQDEHALLAWRHQLDLFRKAKVVLPDLLDNAFHLGLIATFNRQLTEASQQKLIAGWEPAQALKALQDRAAIRHMKKTDKRLKTLIEGRKRLVEEALDRHYIALPVNVYDNGSNGTVIRARCSLSWDPEDCNGWIYLPWKKARKEFSGTDDEIKEKALGCMRGELDEYNAYLAGDVYGFAITGERGERLDSCWGFYGFEYCLEEAKSCC